jgi:hypothetical protein
MAKACIMLACALLNNLVAVELGALGLAMTLLLWVSGLFFGLAFGSVFVSMGCLYVLAVRHKITALDIQPVPSFPARSSNFGCRAHGFLDADGILILDICNSQASFLHMWCIWLCSARLA